MSASVPAGLLARGREALLVAVRGVLAASVTAFILAALPYGLIRYIGWPLPHQVPSLTQLKADFTSPVLGDQAYLNAIAIVIWLLWLLITVSFTLETIALVRGIELPALPGLRPTQALAVMLLTAIGLTAMMARTAAPAQAATATQVPARAPAVATAPVAAGSDLAAQSTAAMVGPSLADPAETVHTVVPGDNLYDIAQTDYGNGSDWTVLYTDNAGRPQTDGQMLTDPDLIQPGWILYTTDPNAQPATPAPATASTPSNAVPAPSHTPALHNTAHAPASAVHPALAPTRSPTSAATEQRDTSSTPAFRHTPSAPTSGPRRVVATASASPEWIDLAEGGTLAVAVLAALALALRRARKLRRWYGTCYWPARGQNPTEPLTIPVPLRPATRRVATAAPGDFTELDEFGAPIDSADEDACDTTATTQGPQQHAAHFSDHTAQVPGQDVEASDAGPARIAVAAADNQLLSLQDLTPALALTGPGALPAARALVAAVLSAVEHQHEGARLLICRQDAALLLGCAEADLPTSLATVPDLELAENSADALSQLEQYVAYRARLLEEHDVTALEETPDYDDDYFPPVVLLAVARPDHASRISATVTAGAVLRAHAILLGEHPDAPAWRLDADGHVDGPDAPAGTRMFHLSAEALASALTVLAEATGDALREVGPPVPPNPCGELDTPKPEPGLTSQSTVGEQQTGSTSDPDTAVSATAGTDTAATQQATTTEREGEGRPSGETDTAKPGRPEPGSPSTATTAATDALDVAAKPPLEGRPAPSHAHIPGPPLLVTSADADRVAQITEQYVAHPVQIKVLGVRTITTPTGTIDSRLRGDAWRAAMKLALAGHHGQHLDDFAALWPDHDDPALRATVRNAVYDLRKTLKRRCEDPASHPGRYITQVNHRYALNQHTVAVDLATFGALRTLAAQTRDLRERAAAAEAALALYDGDLLSGEDEEWMISPRIKTRRDALATATLLAQLADHADDMESALNWWERALQIDDNEEVYRQILTLQLRMGRYADALATRDLLMVRLSADDLAPSPETLAILARLHNRRPVPGNRVRPTAA